ncbi:MAG: DNA-3-methyladenine glycosylase [Rhodothermaceae bacterium]
MTEKKKLYAGNKKEAVEFLIKTDPLLAKLIKEFGNPKLWTRPEGFETLINIIVEQMLSVKAAASIFERFKKTLKKVTPQNILKADDEKLREVGLSYSKIKYCKNISQAVVSGELDLEALKKMDNKKATKTLTSIKGVGDWTANIYLMACMKRADIWPYGDNALALAVQKFHKIKEYPTKKELVEIGNRYAPWRSMAAFIYWNTYN